MIKKIYMCRNKSSIIGVGAPFTISHLLTLAVTKESVDGERKPDDTKKRRSYF